MAAALRVSPALVYKWCEPPAGDEDPDQSGARNPLDRVREMYMLTKDIHLVRYLCNCADGFFVSNPVPELRKTPDEHIFDHTRRLIREFSNLLDSVDDSVDDDDHIDADEAAVIRQRWEDLKASTECFVIACERGHYHLKRKYPKPGIG